MDPRLQHLISDYRKAVSESIKILEANGIKRPKSDIEWVTNEFKGRGIFADGTKYYKHGIGCEIKTNKFTVDFDFGKDGQIIKIDYYRLNDFAENNLDKYNIKDSKELEILIKTVYANGVIL